jgi:hypothetical protein
MSIHLFVTLWLLEVVMIILAISSLIKHGGQLSVMVVIWKFRFRFAFVQSDL